MIPSFRVPTRLDEAPIASADELHDVLRDRLLELLAQAPELARAYAAGDPVPHVVLDDFLPKPIADGLLRAFPRPDDRAWTALPTEDQKQKFCTREEWAIPGLLRTVLMHLNSGLFLRFLEELTGIEELVADAKLAGGGLHRIEDGGKLSVHVDFSHHPRNGLHRRLNLLLYLNPDWRDEYGGSFELWKWEKDDKRPVAKVAPLFNRCVVFSTSPTSYHGHPEPLRLPAGLSRRSMALYYFSNGRPEAEAAEHNTVFHSRPGEGADARTRFVRLASSGLVRDVLPPIVYRTVRRLWNERFTTQD